MSENINMVDALHKTIYNQNQQIAELKKQLEEKDKEIETKNSINNLYKATVSLRDNDFKDLVYENNSLKQQLKSQPAEIVEKIRKEFQKHLIDWYEDEENINSDLYLDADWVWEILDTILKEYQK